MEEQIVHDGLQVYEAFCECFESMLRSSEDDEANAYADEVGKTVEHIKSGSATPQAVQEEVLDHLVKAGVPEETREAIDKEPLLSSQQLDTIYKTSMVVLTVTAIALTVSGVLSPIGAAALAAIRATASLLSGLGSGSILDKKNDAPKETCQSFKEHMEHDRAEDPEVHTDSPSPDVDAEPDEKKSEDLGPG